MHEPTRRSATHEMVGDDKRRTIGVWFMAAGGLLLVAEVFHLPDLIPIVMGFKIVKSNWHYIFVGSPTLVGLFLFAPDVPMAAAKTFEVIGSVLQKLRGGNNR